MSHCNCCVPECPTPTLECQRRSITFDDFDGHDPYSRRVLNESSGVFEDLPDIPSQTCIKYSIETEVRGWSTPYLRTQGLDTERISGSISIVNEYPDIGCVGGSRLRYGSGSITHVKEEYRTLIISQTPEETITESWIDRRETTTWSYVEGTVGTFRRDEIIERFERPDEDGSQTSETFTDTGTTSFNGVPVGTGVPANFYTSRSFSRTHTESADIRVVDVDQPNFTASGVQFTTETLSEPWSSEAIVEDLRKCLEDEEWDDSGSCFSEYSVARDSNECIEEVEFTQARVRIVIPHDFNPPPPPEGNSLDDLPLGQLPPAEWAQRWHGLYHRLEYRMVFTPTDHNPTDPQSPAISVISSGQILWTGAGRLINFEGFDSLPEDEKEAIQGSWVSDWVELASPPEEGRIDFRLVRSQCYRGGAWLYH